MAPKMTERTDWELVAEARSGNMNAFAELVRRYQSPVIHFCQRMVGSIEEAEDLAQESFIRVYRYLDRLRPMAQFQTVLFGIARNLTLNAIRDARRWGRQRTQPLTRRMNPNEPERAVADSSSRPDRAAGLGEIERVLSRALARLTPKHREMVVLRDLQGLDYDAIARITRVRKGTVKSRLARAREQLRIHVIRLGGEQFL